MCDSIALATRNMATEAIVATRPAPNARSVANLSRFWANRKPRPVVPIRNSATIAARTAWDADNRNAIAILGNAAGRARRHNTVSRPAPSTRKRSSLPGGRDRRPDEVKTKLGKKVITTTTNKLVVMLKPNNLYAWLGTYEGSRLLGVHIGVYKPYNWL